MREIETTDHSPREQLEIRRRRLQFRCWHRGTQELDLVLGSVAETFLEHLDGAQLECFEALLDCPDVDLFDWIFFRIAPPPQHDHDLMRLLRGVAEKMFEQDLAQVERLKDIRAWIERQLYRPQYEPARVEDVERERFRPHR